MWGNKKGPIYYMYNRINISCFRGTGTLPNFLSFWDEKKLRHNKGFPTCIVLLWGSRNTKKIFHSNRGEESAQNGHALFPVFSGLTKNSNFALDWSRNKTEGTKIVER
eukprot:sb/3477576/